MFPVLLGMAKTEVDMIFGGLTIALAVVVALMSFPVVGILRSVKKPDKMDRQIQFIWLVTALLLVFVGVLYLLLRRSAG